MSDYHIVVLQPSARAQAQAAASAQPAVAGDVGPGMPTGDQLREQIRQTIQDATRAATEAQGNMQLAVRDAERRVRDAERHVREARTGDQRGAAQQELFAARTELSALRGASQVNVHTEQPTRFADDMIPPQVVDMSIAFFIMLAVIIIGLPLARAMGRRLERRTAAPALPDPAIANQLQRIEQAVEAMSIEIERISESQRFMAKLQNGTAERTPLGAGERH
ncbi:MAG: hypothetical protein HOQ19_10325 [Gemmatimonadaceae bacterium]|nr:hypothetical protein [Gemmatimonadaceae bacterium]